jgi:hypothetical protein
LVRATLWQRRGGLAKRAGLSALEYPRKRRFTTEDTEFGLREEKKLKLRKWVATDILKAFLCALCVESLLRPQS